MSPNKFLEKLNSTPEMVTFSETMAAIELLYEFTPVFFSNGDISNAAGENNGSCKIFAFGSIHQLTQAQTLHCFGDFYRKDVLENPEGNDHQNIRNFMCQGWQGICFEGQALELKAS